MKLTYRPEIDGLRAIAVSAVILYHARITIFGHQAFEGGFIGVDIFFVISGYLITSIILKELVTTGTFSFKYFYERRIRRILPALMFVFLASFPFAWMYLLQSSFVDFSKSILYSLGFGSNFYFHYSGQQYAAVSGLIKPFLHTWSLSVEEQFYIIFPAVLMVTFKYFRKYLIYILILGFVVSLALSDWGSRNYPSFNFYLLPTRSWELLAGSILAYFEIKLGYRCKYKILNLIFPSIGLFLIGYSILFFNDEVFHPSFYTLSPIIGVCLLLWFSNKDEIVTKILSFKLFVVIGLISYSLYLWHYPIFAFARISEFVPGNISKKILLGSILLLLSFVSYYFIERPARNKENRFSIIFGLIMITIFFLVILSSQIILKEGYKNRLPEIFFYKDLSEQPRTSLKNLDGINCYGKIGGCKFNISSNKKVYIIGDSHAGSIMFDLKDRIVEKNYQFITYSYGGGCLFYPGFNLVTIKTSKINEKCNNSYFTKLKEILSKQKDATIIFVGRFPLHLTNYFFDNQEGGREGGKWTDKYISVGKYKNIQDSFKNEVLELSKNNKIILIYPIPEVGINPNKKIFLSWVKRKNRLSRNFNLKNVTTSYQVYKERTQSSFELLDAIQSDNIYRIYPHKLFCDTNVKERCVTHDNKNIFYADDDHPSFKGAEMINSLIMKKIK